ncbi:hypothetical protein PR048_002711 [Dryococelus australis]|uniref:Uncharacterized protein n=1 Tax=Dryococelus australis TaxID=614101 RepID=A0ABQ9IKY6_9NEOP|nr:hypothetical protein PR048_002711 [Dryococelus australis]
MVASECVVCTAYRHSVTPTFTSSDHGISRCRGQRSGSNARLLPRRTGFDSRRTTLGFFELGNCSGRCCWSMGFLGDLLFPPLSHSSSAPYPSLSTSIGSQDLFVNCHPRISTPRQFATVRCCCHTEPRAARDKETESVYDKSPSSPACTLRNITRACRSRTYSMPQQTRSGFRGVSKCLWLWMTCASVHLTTYWIVSPAPTTHSNATIVYGGLRLPLGIFPCYTDANFVRNVFLRRQMLVEWREPNDGNVRAREDIEVSMGQRRNKWTGETGDPREYPPTSGIVRHYSRLRKSGVNRQGLNPVRLSGRRSWGRKIEKLQTRKSYKEEHKIRNEYKKNLRKYGEKYKNKKEEDKKEERKKKWKESGEENRERK